MTDRSLQKEDIIQMQKEFDDQKKSLLMHNFNSYIRALLTDVLEHLTSEQSSQEKIDMLDFLMSTSEVNRHLENGRYLKSRIERVLNGGQLKQKRC